MNADKYNVLVGEVISTFGNKGELKVYPHTDFPERLTTGRHVCLKHGDDEALLYKIVRSRPHKNILIMKFAEIADMNAAEELRGWLLYTSESDRKPLAENEFYISDVIGMSVITTDGDDLGVVKEVLRSPANDVYVTDRAMIPAVKEFIVSMDTEGKRMVVNPVKGLIQDSL